MGTATSPLGSRAARRTSATRCLHLALLCSLLAGCSFIDWLGGRERVQDFCTQHPDDPSCHMDMPDADTRCTSNASCMAPTGVCDLAGSRMCIQCLLPDQTSACTGTTPTCGADNACHACSKHEDCPASSACLPDGSCAAANQVAYVDGMQGAGAVCSLAMPCKKISDALGTHLPYVKVNGQINDQIQINDNVTILANPGSTLTSTMNGVLVEVRGSSQVAIYDLSIMGASGPGGTGIGISLPAGNSASLTLGRVAIADNSGAGISATGGTLTLSHATISGNTGAGISANTGTLEITSGTISGNNGVGISMNTEIASISQSTIGGNVGGGLAATSGSVTISRSTFIGPGAAGITISGSQFDITNNIITGNGGPTSVIGGIRFDQITSGTRRFEFNTVTNNAAMDGNAVGVLCTLVSQPITFANSIIYNNQTGGTRTQVGGTNCNWQYSDIGPDTVGGTGNINMDPLFVDPAHNNFHVQAASMVKDKADPTSMMNIDIDGDSRPQGAGRDMGADEIK